MTIDKKMLEASAGWIASQGAEAPQGVFFDGTNDYLRKATDFTGSTDSSEFTFSFWIYRPVNSVVDTYDIYEQGNLRFNVGIDTTNFSVIGVSSTGTTLLTLQISEQYIGENAWQHIMVSCDLSDASKRHVVINRRDVTSAVSFTNYTNGLIDFTDSTLPLSIGSALDTLDLVRGGLAHVFLDYTYRDLTVPAVQDLFLTDDNRPQAGLTNILTEVAPFTLGDGTTGTYFDGSTEYLSKTSDLTGNADGTAFTFSAWVYSDLSQNLAIYDSGTNGTLSEGLRVIVDTSGQLLFYGYNIGAISILEANTSGIIQANTWTHVNISLDLANAANRHVYINDVAISTTWTKYSNANINFTVSHHAIGAGNSGTNFLIKGRLAHVYLDYTYRDLSISTNRRLFIDANGNPATGQASLSPILYLPLIDDFTNDGTGGAFTTNGTPSQGDTETTGSPILYLPMTSADTAHVNEGTGGDFTPTGTFFTAEFGPNQTTQKAAYFDSAYTDRLFISDTDAVGLVDGKQFTFSFDFYGGSAFVIAFTDSAATTDGGLVVKQGTGGAFQVTCNGSGSALNLQIPSGVAPILPARIHLSVSVDLTNTANRCVILNGVDITSKVTWSTYSNTDINFTPVTGIYIGRNTATNYSNGRIGQVFVDDFYTDLTTTNPFWDSTTNKPVSVEDVLANTGWNPWIALPISASDPGLNLGTIGNFSSNLTTPEEGRNCLEYYVSTVGSGLTADGSAASNYLENTSCTINMTGGLTIAFVATTYDNKFTTNPVLLDIRDASNNVQLTVQSSATEAVEIVRGTSAVTTSGSTNVFGTAGRPCLVMISIQDNDASSNVVGYYVISAFSSGVMFNTTAAAASGVATGSKVRVLTDFTNTTTGWPGTMGHLYIAEEYIDLSSESNRAKFVDALGQITDWSAKIESGDLPTPKVFLKTDDFTNAGTNSGSDGDFTETGTVTLGHSYAPNLP